MNTDSSTEFSNVEGGRMRRWRATGVWVVRWIWFFRVCNVVVLGLRLIDRVLRSRVVMNTMVDGWMDRLLRFDVNLRNRKLGFRSAFDFWGFFSRGSPKEKLIEPP